MMEKRGVIDESTPPETPSAPCHAAAPVESRDAGLLNAADYDHLCKRAAAMAEAGTDKTKSSRRCCVKIPLR